MKSRAHTGPALVIIGVVGLLLSIPGTKFWGGMASLGGGFQPGEEIVMYLPHVFWIILAIGLIGWAIDRVKGR